MLGYYRMPFSSQPALHCKSLDLVYAAFDRECQSLAEKKSILPYRLDLTAQILDARMHSHQTLGIAPPSISNTWSANDLARGMGPMIFPQISISHSQGGVQSAEMWMNLPTKQRDSLDQYTRQLHTSHVFGSETQQPETENPLCKIHATTPSSFAVPNHHHIPAFLGAEGRREKEKRKKRKEAREGRNGRYQRRTITSTRPQRAPIP